LAGRVICFGDDLLLGLFFGLTAEYGWNPNFSLILRGAAVHVSPTGV